LGPANLLALSGTIVIVIDALDESGVQELRDPILWILSQRLRELPASFRFLLTSRAEPIIQDTFPESTPDVLVKWMPTLETDPSLSNDVLHYIRHMLTDRSGRFLRGLSEQSCEVLATKAEGLFQWAFVACRYITDTRIRAHEDRYRTVTQPGNTSLDGLYKTVLSNVFDQDPGYLGSFRIIMGIALTAVEPLSMRSLEALVGFLKPEESLDVYAFLPALGSLMSGVGEQNAPVRPLHTSFAELLQSSGRGDVYYIGETGHHERLVQASLRLLQSKLHFNMGDLTCSYRLNREQPSSADLKKKISEELAYACRHWGYHISMSTEGFEHSVADLLQHFFLENFLFWLDAASIAGIVQATLPCLLSARNRLQRLGDDIYDLAYDGIRFIRTFARPIVDSAPHVYLSTLVFAPTKSRIYEIYSSKYSMIARVSPSHRPSYWSTAEITIGGFYHPFTSVAFSPDGKRLLTASKDRRIGVFDAHSGTPIREPFIAHGRAVLCVSYFPDGTAFVTGSRDETLRVWDARSFRLLRRLEGHTGAITCIAITSDNSRIISGAEDYTIRVWDAQSGTALLGPLRGHRSAVWGLALAPGDLHVASASKDCTVRSWNLSTGAEHSRPVRNLGRPVRSVSWGRSGGVEAIATGSTKDGRVRVFDTVSVGSMSPAKKHKGVVALLAFSPLDSEGQLRLASCGRDRAVRVWDANTMEPLLEPIEVEWNLKALNFSFDGTQIIAEAHGDDNVMVWDAESGQRLVASDASATVAKDTFRVPASLVLRLGRYVCVAENRSQSDGDKRILAKLPHMAPIKAVRSFGHRLALGLANGSIVIMHFPSL